MLRVAAKPSRTCLGGRVGQMTGERFSSSWLAGAIVLTAFEWALGPHVSELHDAFLLQLALNLATGAEAA